MTDIAPNIYDPKNKVARGWGSDGKPKRMTKRIPPEEAQRLRDEAMKLPPSSVLQSRRALAPAKNGPTAGVGFAC